MQRLTDQLVRDVRSVVIAGVDVVHPRRDGLTQYGLCRLLIPGRPEYSWAGQPHRAVSKPPDEPIAEAECAGWFNAGHRSRGSYTAIDDDVDASHVRTPIRGQKH